MAKNGEEARLKTPKTAAKLGLNLKHGEKKYNNDDNRKMTKFECTREHILGHDWLMKITWNYARGQKLVLRQEERVQSL